MPNSKVLETKKVIVEKITEEIKNACVGIVVDYKGITVESDTELRKNLRENSIKYSVVKNTMLKRAIEIAGLESLGSVLEGSTALATSEEDHITAAKILCDFSKKNEFYNIKAGFIDGKVVSADEIKEIAKLPSKEVLIAKAIGGIQAPISGFASVLKGTIRGLVVALNAIAEKKSA